MYRKSLNALKQTRRTIQMNNPFYENYYLKVLFHVWTNSNTTRSTVNCTGFFLVDVLPSLVSLQSHSLTVESDAEEATRIFESCM